MSYEKDIADVIREVLGNRQPVTIPDPEDAYNHASVLIPLTFENDRSHVILTKRTDRVEHHKGQISFPGGRVDDGDESLEHTALREAEEEIGLAKGDVILLGRLDDTLTIVSNFIIHPFVGMVPPNYHFKLCEAEVERILVVPLELFFSNMQDNYSFNFQGITYRTPALVYHGDVIWGATARIMKNFVAILNGKLPLKPGDK
ncbi:MAG: CoA pyrophosphatase [Deltaproteobacteria bacterium]|nr:MAG: CoA pyrophosphatase [Deltaproteobacteria bacterium]RLB84580.1 MAG: CoA pyrophosphatase [Deltaproteobacteria bacterium]